ncbi:MAG: hypothetical protein EA409_12745 [Saprospirales bacterium]|nr:MAG: hypothetical protein EA409_12745 [Saprospirales bacterium]
MRKRGGIDINGVGLSFYMDCVTVRTVSAEVIELLWRKSIIRFRRQSKFISILTINKNLN